MERRTFLKTGGLVAAAGTLALHTEGKPPLKGELPIVISTWDHGMAANLAAWKILKAGGSALDAVEQGVMIPEADPKITSVGLGGFPDREGKVTLDACIMDHLANIGAVCFLQDIMHPIAVARKVMELTPHVMLVGKGAQKFALDNGFKKEQLLTPSSEAAYKKWLQQSNYEPWIGIQNHDTIGMLAIDSAGNISGACTTSGLAYKMHGRVGDSPIIGAGLFVDNEVGGATATGVGEEVIRICGSHTVVEKMRSGASPEEACAEACKRIAKNMARRKKNAADYQIGFLALDKNGNYGAHSFQSGFDFAITTATRHELIKSNFNNG